MYRCLYSTVWAHELYFKFITPAPIAGDRRANLAMMERGLLASQGSLRFHSATEAGSSSSCNRGWRRMNGTVWCNVRWEWIVDGYCSNVRCRIAMRMGFENWSTLGEAIQFPILVRHGLLLLTKPCRSHHSRWPWLRYLFYRCYRFT